MKNKSLIIGLIFVAIVAGVIYCTAQNRSWKSYSNDAYGFSLSYPANLGYIEEKISNEGIGAEAPDGKVGPLVFQLSLGKDIGREFPHTGIIVLVQKRENITDLALPFSRTPTEITIPSKAISLEEILIDGQKAVKYVDERLEYADDGSTQDAFITEFIVEKSEYVYRVMTFGAGSYYPELIEKVIPTFTFSDEQQILKWETYRNENYGFEFAYPTGKYTVGTTDFTGGPFGAGTVFGACTGDGGCLGAVSVNSTQSSLEDFVKEQKLAAYQVIDFVGHSAYEGVGLGLDIPAPYYGIFVKDGAYIYTIALTHPFPKKDVLAASRASLTDEQKQFIASFKFTK